MSFRLQLLIAIAAVLALAGGLPILYAEHALSRVAEDDFKQLGLLKLAEAKNALTAHGPFADQAKLKDFAQTLAGRISASVDLAARDGALLAASRDSGHTDANIFSLPEMSAARQRSPSVVLRSPAPDGFKRACAATSLPTGAASPVGFVRIETGPPPTYAELTRVRHGFFYLFVGILAGGTLSLTLFTRRFILAVNSMIRSADAIGQGDYTPPHNNYPGTEFRRLGMALKRMAAQIGQSVRSVTEQKEKLEAVLDGLFDGVMVLTPKGRVQSVNKAMTRILPGVEKKAGRAVLETVLSTELHEACSRVLAQDKPGYEHLTVHLGRNNAYEVNIVKPADNSSRLGVIAVFHDISEQSRAESMRRDFVANVSHELRTPLTSIKGYAETLLTVPPSDEQTMARFVEVILRSANHMSKMVDDLLSLSRLEAGKQPFNPVKTNAEVPLDSAWEACMAMAEEKKVQFSVERPKDPVFVLADPDQLTRVFRNLLENAVKYSPDGSKVTVKIQCGREMAEFGVYDQGHGIPAKDRERIFERFYSVEKHRRNQYGSTGLGLAITRHIVRNHGGRIRVESPPNGEANGTAFFFTIPLFRDQR